jgi:ribonuclease HI
VSLANLVADRGSSVTYLHVKGHAGHLLNEAADTLAKVARQWLRNNEHLDRAAMTARATDLAAAFLTTWKQEQAAKPL